MMQAKLAAAAVFVVLVSAGPGLAIPSCDPLDPALCLLPFPNDHFTAADESSATGRRVAIDPLSTPRNRYGKPVDPTEWNRNDGFSPGSMILTFVPDLDLAKTWGTTVDHIADIGRFEAADAPIVIVNAATGERHPFWSELDFHPRTPATERLLILRPAINFEEGARYVVALRNLKDGADRTIPAGEAFAHYRDGTSPLLPDAAFEERRVHVEALFGILAGAGIARESLYLAWDFTVASAENLAGRVLHMRDESFAALGDANLADLVVAGSPPSFTITSVTDFESGRTKRRIEGTVTVPNYLDRPPMPPVDEIENDVEDLPGQSIPGARLFYGADGKPEVNPLQPTLEAPFVCSIPVTASAANPARPSLYGHGLLGSRNESTGSSAQIMTENHNFLYCATDWIGMADEDIVNVATILQDVSHFPSLADRAQQGFLNFLFLGRAMIHPQGFAAAPELQDGGQPQIDVSELFYDGNSQGGIMGGALAALAPDFTKAVLGVPGMNYSTLLHRSVDWEGHLGELEPLEVGYATLLYTFYPDKQEQLLVMALIQMLWDRAEANGYARHMATDPYPNTPAHQVLMHVAFGDYQVANVAAEVEARTIGARILETSLAKSRHWEVEPFWGLEDIPRAEPFHGSALVYWDSGNPTPPNANVPPADLGQDPHSDPRRDPNGGVQKAIFYTTGEIVDVFDGEPYCSFRFSRHPELFPTCPTD